MTTRRARTTRTTSLPATRIQAEEEYIRRALRTFRNLTEEKLGSAAGYAIFESYFLHRLQNSDDVLEAVFIVDVAKRGHPPADRALRQFGQMAIQQDRLHELPVAVRAYTSEGLGRPPLSHYPSQAPQVVDHFIRDVAISYMIHRLKIRFPAVPKLYSSGQRCSAARLVGDAFGLSEARARSIFLADGEQALKIGEFFADYAAPVNEAVVFAPAESFP